MKKVFIVALCMVLITALAFTGCAARDTGEEAAEETAEEAAEEAAEDAVPVAGGWAINTDTQSLLTEEQQQIFDAAMEGLVGANFTPVAVTAKQLVAGENYQFLCIGEPVVKDPAPAWEIVNVYVDLKDVCTLVSINDLDLADPELAEADDTDVVGGWECAIEGNAVTGDAAAAFDKTSGEFDGIKLTPAVLLGTQVVAGTNYKMLCKGEKGGKAYPCIATVYADLEGNAEITDCGILDVADYAEDKTVED